MLTRLQEDTDLEKTSLFAHVGTFRSAFLAPLLQASVHDLQPQSHEAVAPSLAW